MRFSFQVCVYWWAQEHVEQAASVPRAVVFLTWFASFVDAIVMKGPRVVEALFGQPTGVDNPDAQTGLEVMRNPSLEELQAFLVDNVARRANALGTQLQGGARI